MYSFEQNYSQFLQIPIGKRVCLLKMSESYINKNVRKNLEFNYIKSKFNILTVRVELESVSLAELVLFM